MKRCDLLQKVRVGFKMERTFINTKYDLKIFHTLLLLDCEDDLFSKQGEKYKHCKKICSEQNYGDKIF